MNSVTAPVFRFGNDVDTDVIVPGQYLKLGYEEAAAYVMEGIRPGFGNLLQNGGIIIAGENFGCGSSREAAPAALKFAGIRAVIAPYFARIFYRNAINVGLPAIECPEVVESPIQEGEWVTIDFVSAFIQHNRTGNRWSYTPLSLHLREILLAGGLVPFLKGQRQSDKGARL
ncbi:MAG: 3-isopropylmalate dehydratase [Sulfobacillus benefaciens]|uniref:3-isopropylmalate dehydratase small subunit n=1 Tax=Sulfobacillus benefaciens TaxID=453960 RepID=A0A2T2XLZ1_9FIRM|nr:MAG: 3-isopropylmalate dehydratase [Sulfobacillus benefaciens]